MRRHAAVTLAAALLLAACTANDPEQPPPPEPEPAAADAPDPDGAHDAWIGTLTAVYGIVAGQAQPGDAPATGQAADVLEQLAAVTQVPVEGPHDFDDATVTVDVDTGDASGCVLIPGPVVDGDITNQRLRHSPVNGQVQHVDGRWEVTQLDGLEWMLDADIPPGCVPDAFTGAIDVAVATLADTIATGLGVHDGSWVATHEGFALDEPDFDWITELLDAGLDPGLIPDEFQPVELLDTHAVTATVADAYMADAGSTVYATVCALGPWGFVDADGIPLLGAGATATEGLWIDVVLTEDGTSGLLVAGTAPAPWEPCS